jgi:hypothetical protein
MKIKVFYPNEKGHIELTKEKLESLLNEAYNEGYRDGKNNSGYYYGITTTPYISSTSNVASISSTTPCLSVDCDKVTSSTTNDCIYTDAKISAIDCYVNTNDRVTTLESNPKNAIIVEYAEASNET